MFSVVQDDCDWTRVHKIARSLLSPFNFFVFLCLLCFRFALLFFHLLFHQSFSINSFSSSSHFLSWKLFSFFF